MEGKGECQLGLTMEVVCGRRKKASDLLFCGVEKIHLQVEREWKGRMKEFCKGWQRLLQI